MRFVRRVQPLFHIMVALAAAVQLSSCAATPKNSAGPQSFQIVRLDPRFDKLVPRDAKLEKIADGFTWVEGPVWNREGRYLLFSDIPKNSVFKWKEGEGVSLFLNPSGYTGSAPFEGQEPGSNGLTFDSGGRLVLCAHGDRRIARLEPDGRKTTLADRYEGKRINSPNGRVFFDATRWRKDPYFGPDGMKIDRHGNLFGARPGGISVFAPDGTHLGSIETDLPTSNMAWGEDGSVLYVTGGSAIYRIRLGTKGAGF